MSLKEDLEKFRAGHPGIEDLVYADLTSQMVLFASSLGVRPQEVYDSHLKRALSLLPKGGSASVLAGAIGADPGDALLVDADGSAVRLIVRAAANADECLILGCAPGAELSAIAAAAAKALTRFAAAGNG